MLNYCDNIRRWLNGVPSSHSSSIICNTHSIVISYSSCVFCISDNWEGKNMRWHFVSTRMKICKSMSWLSDRTKRSFSFLLISIVDSLYFYGVALICIALSIFVYYNHSIHTVPESNNCKILFVIERLLIMVLEKGIRAKKALTMEGNNWKREIMLGKRARCFFFSKYWWYIRRMWRNFSYYCDSSWQNFKIWQIDKNLMLFCETFVLK